MREISYFAYSFFKIIVLQRAHAQHTRHQSKRTGVGGGGLWGSKEIDKSWLLVWNSSEFGYKGLLKTPRAKMTEIRKIWNYEQPHSLHCRLYFSTDFTSLVNTFKWLPTVYAFTNSFYSPKLTVPFFFFTPISPSSSYCAFAHHSQPVLVSGEILDLWLL